jgi:protein-S-isoprenylcysteine O-methyltransferase Ste14
MTLPERLRPNPRFLDLFERVAIALLFGWLTLRFAETLGDHPANLIFIASEGLVAIFIIFRRPTEDISTRPMDWAIGVLGTMLTMLVAPAGGGWEGAAGLMLAGLVVSLGAKLSLRRSFGVVAANRGVKKSGLYAMVRHPMYLGYFVTNIGVMILNPSIWNACLLGAWAVCQIFRIHAEERVLNESEDYRSHVKKVRFRLLPFVY